MIRSYIHYGPEEKFLVSVCTYDKDGNEISHTEYWEGIIPFCTEYQYQNLDQITPTVVPVSDIFTDVPEKAWYTPYVQYAYDNDLMSGVGLVSFAPAAKLTRAQVVQILYNQAGRPTVTGAAKFSDVKSGSWYYNAVQWAAQNKIVSGVGNGKFAPDQNVTREQLAVVLYNREKNPAVSGVFTGFADSAKVSGWAKKAMLWATQNNIICGSKENKKMYLNPQGNATRAEAATMMMKYLKK